MSGYTKGPWHVTKQYWPGEGGHFVVCHDQGDIKKGSAAIARAKGEA